jgi:hypothetical protein
MSPAAAKWHHQILAAAVDGAVVESGTDQAHPDVSIRTRDGRSIAMDVKWAGEGWPQDVRRAASDVPDPWPPEVVVLARQLSPGAIEWLRERGANWADEAGQARLLGPKGLIVIREPARPPREERPARSFRWSPSALTVAEAILSRTDRPLPAAELAHISGWSLPQVANVLKAFDAQGWTIKRGPARGPRAHRALLDADALLAAWSAGVAEVPHPTRIAHRATRDVIALLRGQLAPALDRTAGWALSGWAGLEIAAPFATATPTLHVYVAESDFAGPLSDAIERAGLREVEEGGRVTFRAADTRTLALAMRRDDLPVVSAPRLFADLTALGGRGQDAADHVKELLIDPLHPPDPSAAEDTNG